MIITNFTIPMGVKYMEQCSMAKKITVRVKETELHLNSSATLTQVPDSIVGIGLPQLSLRKQIKNELSVQFFLLSRRIID